MTRVNENGMMNRYGKRNSIHGAAEDPNNFHCIGISSCMHDYRAISLKTPHKEPITNSVGLPVENDSNVRSVGSFCRLAPAQVT